MPYQVRGMVYFAIGISAAIYAAVYPLDLIGFIAGLVAGVFISWSYWYWWRKYWLKLFKKNIPG